MQILFVCSENRLRSATAEAVFSQYAHLEALGCGTNADAETPLSGDLIVWAEKIFVMEKCHKTKLSKKYQALLKGKKVICLDIPDHYHYMQPELVQLLKHKIAPFVPGPL